MPGQVELYNIEIRPYGLLLQPGQRLALKLRCRDDEPPRDVLQQLGQGGIWRPNAARITILHNAEHPFTLHLPITRGNRIGTYLNGGTLLPAPGWGEGFAPMEQRT